MDSILQVKEALVARSTVASLDDLKSQGRNKVKVIRAEHIAAMVQEAVQQAIGGTDMMSRDEVDALVERSQDEFKHIISEREQQLVRLREAMQQLEEVKEERIRLQASLQEVMVERNALREDLEETRARLERQGQSSGQQPAVAASSDPALMMQLMTEVAQLKAMQGQATPALQQPVQGNQAQGDGLTAAIDKLAGTLNDRLEKFGRKMGISSAVEGKDVNFDALFEKDSAKKLESNMDSVQIKKKQESGIHANLERLRKLKGGN